MPGQVLHKVPLFGWAIFVTAVLLLLSLPVLAGKLYNVLSALNLAICWNNLRFVNLSQSAGNQIGFNLFGILRDYTPELMCCIVFLFRRSYSINSNKGLKNFLKLEDNFNIRFSSNLTGIIKGDGLIIVPKKERSLKGKLYYPSIQISFDLKNFLLALMIQK